MKKKDFKYHLKKDVRNDLENLRFEIDFLLSVDVIGFYNVPTNRALPELFKVFAHLIWVRSYKSWFKKIYI